MPAVSLSECWQKLEEGAMQLMEYRSDMGTSLGKKNFPWMEYYTSGFFLYMTPATHTWVRLVYDYCTQQSPPSCKIVRVLSLSLTKSWQHLKLLPASTCTRNCATSWRNTVNRFARFILRYAEKVSHSISGTSTTYGRCTDWALQQSLVLFSLQLQSSQQHLRVP